MKIPFVMNDKSQRDKKDKILMLPTDKILANPYQPRTFFGEDEIKELASSIKNYGIIQPITVREMGGYYELITGERRLRASQQLGLEEIPAILKDISDKEVAEIALVENLQRKDLSFLEEARGYQQIITKFNLKQNELAERIGKSQSTIANKMRILSLTDQVLEQIDSSLITERHARSLLQLTDESKQLQVIDKIKEKELTVKETERLITKINNEKKDNVITTYIKDLRIFTNTLKKSVNEMKTAGLEVEMDKFEDDDFIEFKIRLPKRK